MRRTASLLLACGLFLSLLGVDELSRDLRKEDLFGSWKRSGSWLTFLEDGSFLLELSSGWFDRGRYEIVGSELSLHGTMWSVAEGHATLVGWEIHWRPRDPRNGSSGVQVWERVLPNDLPAVTGLGLREASITDACLRRGFEAHPTDGGGDGCESNLWPVECGDLLEPPEPPWAFTVNFRRWAAGCEAEGEATHPVPFAMARARDLVPIDSGHELWAAEFQSHRGEISPIGRGVFLRERTDR